MRDAESMVEGGRRARRRERARPVPVTVGERRQPASTRGKATILVVDDDDAIRDFLRSALESEGYAVLAAGDGVDALSLCERYAVDVILLDLMMPRLGGLAFLGRFRQRWGPNGTAVFVMSAVRSAIEQTARETVNGVFVKPFDLDELLDTIADAVPRPSGPGSGGPPAEPAEAERPQPGPDARPAAYSARTCSVGG